MDDMGVGDAPHQTEQSFPYTRAHEQTHSQHGMRMIRIWCTAVIERMNNFYDSLKSMVCETRRSSMWNSLLLRARSGTIIIYSLFTNKIE